ncbi:MAG: HAMP domain-containing sensor histidine kinase [Actinomycetota bacterium]
MEGTVAEATRGRADRPPLVLFEFAIIVPVLAYLGYEVPRRWDEVTPIIAFFVAAVAVVDLIPIPGWGGLQLSLSFPLLLGVAIIYEPPLAAAVALVGSFDPREFRRQIPIFTAIWNRCQMALSVLTGSALYHGIAQVDSPWTRVVPGIVVATVVSYAVNALCVAMHTALYRRISVASVLANMHGQAPAEFLLAYIGLGMYGAVIARLYVFEGFWSVPVLLLPLAFARQMYFRSRSLADRLSEQNAILTEQAKKLEELLEMEHHRVDELSELNRMKGEFVAVVSHELRTPVTALIGYARTLHQPEFAEDPAMRHEFLDRMERQGDRLVRLIENLLTASRIESRELPLSIGQVSFDELACEVVEGLAVEAGRMVCSIPEDLAILYTDRHLLGRVLSNLLDNALKYSPVGSPCELGARADDGNLVFWVKDHGIGISPEELPLIFEPFYQVDSSSTRTFRGAGLGLSLVRDLLRHLGGTITAESSPGEGSCFTVTLPFHRPNESAPAGDAKAQAPS